MEDNKEKATVSPVETPAATKEPAKKEKSKEKESKVVDNRVEVFIPKGNANDDPNFFVSVNGVNYLLPRGKTSKVPPHIAYEINRSRKAEEKQDSNIDSMIEASK